MLAFKAFNTNISAEPDYLPLIAATGVFFLKANYVTQLYLHDHSLCFEKLMSYYEVEADR